MRTIVRIKFGSHLYGTATPASDLPRRNPIARSLRRLGRRVVASKKRYSRNGLSARDGSNDH